MAGGKLSVRTVEAAKHPGAPERPIKVADGNGMFLQISRKQTKSWLLRYTLAGKTREMGLGPFGQPPLGVTLADARKAAAEAHALARRGIDPINQREIAKRQEAAERLHAAAHTFRSVAEEMIDEREKEWRNAKHRAQWRSTLETYAYPTLGKLPISEITTVEILRVLKPIWSDKPETASRLRGRIERVLSNAKVRGLREGDNPAIWRGHLAEMLPSPRRIQGKQPGHHPALPWNEISAFMVDLRSREALAARALELLILTACRTNEVLGAKWAEIDLDAGTWTIPASRMKAKREHRVALSNAAIRVLRGVMPLRPTKDGYVFSGNQSGSCLSTMALLMLLRRMNTVEKGHPPRWRDGRTGQLITAHGFRSTFRDWVGEHSGHPTDLAEIAMAHVVRDKTVAAYARGDLFEKRLLLMADWAAFCGTQCLDAEAAQEGGLGLPITKL